MAEDTRRETDWDRDEGRRGYRRYRDADDRRYGAGDYEQQRGGGSYYETPQFGRPAKAPYRTPGPLGDTDYRGERVYGAGDYEQRRGYRDDGRGERYGGRDEFYGGSDRGREEHHRSFWDRAGDEVASWLGDRDAERRRELDRFEAGAHRGRGPTGYKRSDARIAEDVNDRLTDDAWIDATGVMVEVKEGEVTLNGTVYRREDKRRAEDIADRISGVVHVQNNLRVQRPSGDELESPPRTNPRF